MENNYLAWYKEIEIAITNRKDINPLLASSVSQPTELLLSDLKRFSAQIEKRISYSNAYGHPLFIEAVSKRYGIPYDNVVITNGVSNGIYLVCRALLDKGDHIIIETPVYQSLRFVPEFIGAEISIAERKSPGFKLDIEQVLALMKPSTKMILLTNLHNPTGAFTFSDELSDLADRAKQTNPEIKIFVDEIYRDFVPGDLDCAYKIDDCFISLNSLTKVYGLGIIHQGWLIADKITTGKVKYLQNLVEGSGSRFLESFASLVVENLESYRNRAITMLKSNSNILSQYIQPLIDQEIISGSIPQYGCVYFPKIEDIKSTERVVQKLIDDYKIYLVPGNFFYAPQHLRIGFGGEPTQLGESLDAFSGAILKLV